MGREIRRVPPDWEHPRDAQGNTLALYDASYQGKMKEYEMELAAWQRGEGRDQQGQDPTDLAAFHETVMSPPDKETYRARHWEEGEASAYQIYENVSEGSPVSPVFPDQESMITWLRGEGYSEAAIKGFIKMGSVPSLIFFNGRMLEGIEAAAVMSGE